MKKMWKSSKGVSPIIATILMVAITVVLASVLYVLVSGYTGGVGSPPISGALAFRADQSDISGGNVTFVLSMQAPANPPFTDVSVTILSPDGDIVSNVTYEWVHVTSESTHLKGGDRIIISHTAGESLAEYEVLVSSVGYQGTFGGKVPT